MTQSPMISVPLKATNDVDWITPLKSHIRHTYGDDPERYAEECATLNRMRQDMRGAGKESPSGRDMLYRYYGQLELLDLRFPVDEQHIKIAFTWFDAFTRKPTTQYSLAFEKASVIFNIAAVLSCHAAFQNRSDESALKTAYHSFQASAGMFTYINENFLHAPSNDLSRETVKTLIHIMLAQAQEAFLERQVADQKKTALLAKLASQAAYLFSQAIDGIQENLNKAIFDKVWLAMVQIKAHLLNSAAHYYQGLTEGESGEHGVAVSHLKVAENLAKEADRMSKGFPASVPLGFNLSLETRTIMQELSQRQLSTTQEKLKAVSKDNDFVYQQEVPPEASLPAIPKLPAAKPIPVAELYAVKDITRITGPDLFSKIVPMAVTESASLYDEEKAKLVRAEAEKVDLANSRMAASLDYLRLPGALQVLKGGFDQHVLPDEDFREWCIDVAEHDDPDAILDLLRAERESITSRLDQCSKKLGMEESVCEKMRSKYGGAWPQEPSARLTATLRAYVRDYREALAEAQRSNDQLTVRMGPSVTALDQMRDAAESGTIDLLFQKAVSVTKNKGERTAALAAPEANLLDADFDEGRPSVVSQIGRVEEILKILNQVKRERNQVLKDLKEKVHQDDISQVLILNKKSISSYENKLFEQELAKFKPHQNRLLQANHKQTVLMKDLTAAFNALLQDKRVRSEQSKYESIQRQRSLAISKYKKAYEEFLDVEPSLKSAKSFYAEIKEFVGNLEENVESYVNNRRSEGGQLLKHIEQAKSANKKSQSELDRERLRRLMELMSLDPRFPSSRPADTAAPGVSSQHGPMPHYPQGSVAAHYSSPEPPPPPPPPPPMTQNARAATMQQTQQQGQASYAGQLTYVPSQYGRTPGPTSPPPTQTSFGHNVMHGPASPPPTQSSFSPAAHTTYRGYAGSQPDQPGHGSHMPPGYVPPPPPPGPPLGPQQTIQYGSQGYEYATNAQAPGSPSSQEEGPNDPWAGLNAWK